MKERITRYATGLSFLCLVACMGCESNAELKARDHFVEDEKYKEYAQANTGMCNNRLYRRFMAAAKKEMGYANAYVLWSCDGSHSDTVFSGVLRRGNELFAVTLAVARTGKSKFVFVGPVEDKRLLAKFKWLMQNKRDMFALQEEAVSGQTRYSAQVHPYGGLLARDSSGDIVSLNFGWYADILGRARYNRLYAIEECFDSPSDYGVWGYQYDVRLLRHIKRMADWYSEARSLLDAVHLEYAEKTHTPLGSVPYRADAKTPWCGDLDWSAEEDDD